MCGIMCLIYYNKDEFIIEEAKYMLSCINHRGPDFTSYKILNIGDKIIFLGFTRLSIMDLSENGNQPFELNNTYVVCNGEIYNHEELKKSYGIITKSNSDCEIIIPLYNRIGYYNMEYNLDAEYALILVDLQKKKLYVSRDNYGVRPLFIGIDDKRKIMGFSSEMKVFNKSFISVLPITPSIINIIDLESNLLFHDTFNKIISYDSITVDIESKIRNSLIKAVEKRLFADREIGFLLSGGLDSSLIVSIATRILGPDNITCFSIGLEDSSDVIAAKKVTEYLGIKKHHIVNFDINLAFDNIPLVIKCIESYDITTIRASVPQYIMAKYIKEHTNIKVLLSGEGSDEIHGSYKYFKNVPDKYFRKETLRLLNDLYMFDNLRTDRTMANFGLEVRIPFLDRDYVKLIISSKYKLWTSNDKMEKLTLRKSFEDYLPNDILFRRKEAFSDAVSNNEVCWYITVQNILNNKITDEEFKIFEENNKPSTKESYYYRKLFDSYYPNRQNIIPYYWLPRYQNEEVFEPSATIL